MGLCSACKQAKGSAFAFAACTISAFAYDIYKGNTRPNNFDLGGHRGALLVGTMHTLLDTHCLARWLWKQ